MFYCIVLPSFHPTVDLCAQGAVPKGNATKEYMESLQLKPGEVIYKCPKCCCIKPERAHHCRYSLRSLQSPASTCSLGSVYTVQTSGPFPVAGDK